MKLKKNEIKLLLSQSAHEAATKYIKRRDRIEHPIGTFDNAGRWYPNDAERLNCSMFRSPSRSYPYSYMLACRTIPHIAHLYHLNSKAELLAVKRVIKALKSDHSVEVFYDIDAKLIEEIKQEEIAKNSCSKTELKCLSQDPACENVVRLLLENGNSGSSVFKYLSKHSSKKIRKMTAENTTTPIHVLEKLENDEEKIVRIRAKDNLRKKLNANKLVA